MIREDIAHEAGLSVETYPGPPLSQVDGTYYLPPGQVTTRIHFCGGTRTFNVNFLLAPPSAQYDILIGGNFISRAGLLIRNPAGFVLKFARETPGKSLANARVITANVVDAEQTAERQRKHREAQLRDAEIEKKEPKTGDANGSWKPPNNNVVRETGIVGRKRPLLVMDDIIYQSYVRC